MRALVLCAASATTLSGCCFTPSPITPIAAPPATAVVAGGGPQLPTESVGAAIPIAHGFGDPILFHGLAGGPRDAASWFGPECRGHVSMEPSQRVRLEASFTSLRFMARGDDDLTLIVRGPGGIARCNDDSDGLNPVVEGTFEPGTYDVFVGRYSSGPVAPYDLGITTSSALMPTTMLGAAAVAPSVGATLRSGVLTVESASGLVQPGDACTFSEVSVAPTSGGSDVRWTITCGTTIVYGAGNGGYGRSSDASWPHGTIAHDLETSAVDTDPSFVWTSDTVRIEDDADGALGAFTIDFVVPGSP